MPGTELFGEEERKEVMDVLNTTCLFRYNHDELRQGMWKARELEAEDLFRNKLQRREAAEQRVMDKIISEEFSNG